jgi:hypothetical protein
VIATSPVRLCRTTGTTVPTLPSGEKLATSTTAHTDSTGLIANTQYTCAAFSYATVGNTTSGVHVAATAAATPPGYVTGLTATALSATSVGRAGLDEPYRRRLRRRADLPGPRDRNDAALPGRESREAGHYVHRHHQPDPEQRVHLRGVRLPHVGSAATGAR